MSTRSKKYRVEGEGPSAEIPSRAIDAHDGGRDVDEDKQELQIGEFYESLGPVGVLSSRLPRCRRDPVRPPYNLGPCSQTTLGGVASYRTFFA